MADRETQRWDLTLRGRRHRVEVQGSLSRTIRWSVDDELVASVTSSDDRVTLSADPTRQEAVGLRFNALGRPRRVTLFEAEGEVSAKARAVLGTGGIDLEPEPGSWAARREERIRQHPWRHAVVATAAGVAKVALPLLLGLLAVRFVVDLPWPAWDVPWPDIDLPGIPWPDIPWPQVPWPDIDLPAWELPGWVRWLLDKASYVWPVLLALGLAMGEIRRRRKQDALRAEARAEARGRGVSPTPDEQRSEADRDRRQRPEDEPPAQR